jgi:hypothetical protein
MIAIIQLLPFIILGLLDLLAAWQCGSEILVKEGVSLDTLKERWGDVKEIDKFVARTW